MKFYTRELHYMSISKCLYKLKIENKNVNETLNETVPTILQINISDYIYEYVLSLRTNNP